MSVLLRDCHIHHSSCAGATAAWHAGAGRGGGGRLPYNAAMTSPRFPNRCAAWCWRPTMPASCVSFPPCSPAGMELVPQGELGVPEAEEPHVTFIENAGQGPPRQPPDGLPAWPTTPACAWPRGARRACIRRATPSMAARNPTWPTTRCWSEAGRPGRPARLVRGGAGAGAGRERSVSAHRRRPLAWRDHRPARGANGFGYDPHFYLPDLGLTAASLDPAEKNSVSHRARALRAAGQAQPGLSGAPPFLHPHRSMSITIPIRAESGASRRRHSDGL